MFFFIVLFVCLWDQNYCLCKLGSSFYSWFFFHLIYRFLSVMRMAFFGEMTILSRPNRNHIIDQLQTHWSERNVMLISNQWYRSHLGCWRNKYQSGIKVIWTLVELRTGMHRLRLWKWCVWDLLAALIHTHRRYYFYHLFFPFNKKCKLHCLQKCDKCN